MDSVFEKDPFAVLAIAPDASLDEIKQAYRTRARQEHPDLFAPAERHRQQMRMMEVNQAYMELIAREQAADESAPDGPGRKGSAGSTVVNPARRQAEPFPGMAVPASGSSARRSAKSKDPAYDLHRRGFDYLARTRALMNPRRNLEDDELRELNFRSALEALRLTRLAYRCFLNVVTGYPDSMWSDDALEQMAGIERSNKVYQRMCENSLKSDG